MISPADLTSLRDGQPPSDGALLAAMTVGAKHWLDPYCGHYLEQFLPAGGSKVKVLVGEAGTGKSHWLRALAREAQARQFVVVSLSLRAVAWRLSDGMALYREIAGRLDQEVLTRGLCQRVARELGYAAKEYDGTGPLIGRLLEDGGLPREQAELAIQKACWRILEQTDMIPDFKTFVANLVRHRLAPLPAGDLGDDLLPLSWTWFRGERLMAAERRACHLYEKLGRTTARAWLYSLVKVLRLAGARGVLLLLDDLDALLERDATTQRYRYTPSRAKDTMELLRQLIDDADLLPHFGVVLAASKHMVQDETRGLMSYEALWMRLQTGLFDTGQFNPWADMVDLDALLASDDHLSKWPAAILKRLLAELKARGCHEGPPLVPSSGHRGPLREAVTAVASGMHPGEAQP